MTVVKEAIAIIVEEAMEAITAFTVVTIHAEAMEALFTIIIMSIMVAISIVELVAAVATCVLIFFIYDAFLSTFVFYARNFPFICWLVCGTLSNFFSWGPAGCFLGAYVVVQYGRSRFLFGVFTCV